MEQNTAWAQINAGTVDVTLYDLVIPVMQCKSAGISPGESRISYVVNAGPQNILEYNSGGAGMVCEFGRDDRDQRDAKMYTIFFDHLFPIGQWRGLSAGLRDKTRVSVVYHNGRPRYLGRHGSPELWTAYHRFCTEIQASPTVSLPSVEKHVTVRELTAAFLDYAKANTDPIRYQLRYATAIFKKQTDGQRRITFSKFNPLGA